MTGSSIFTIKEFKLTRTDLTILEAGIPDGIADVPLSSAASEAFYDLTGRRVLHPAPGQIYLSKGRKVIAR